MITQTSSVRFGTDKGSIGITSKDRFLILQELISDKNIGDKLTEADIKELPKVVLEFFRAESIDVLIGQLERVKYSLENPPENQLALAC